METLTHFQKRFIRRIKKRSATPCKGAKASPTNPCQPHLCLRGPGETSERKRGSEHKKTKGLGERDRGTTRAYAAMDGTGGVTGPKGSYGNRREREQGMRCAKGA